MKNLIIDSEGSYIHEIFDEQGEKQSNSVTLETIKRQISKQFEIENFASHSIKEFDLIDPHSHEIKISIPYVSQKRKPETYFKKSVNWIGIVEELNSKGFLAKLHDKSDKTTFEYAEFEIEEVSDSDLELVKLGSIFYYSIGFASHAGQIKKEAFLRFKRNVPFNNADVDEIETYSEKIINSINWD